MALLTAGCEGEPRVTARPGAEPAPAAAPAQDEIKLTPIIGAKTDDIRDAQAELAQGGAEQSELKITAKDPITLQGNAYVTAVGQISVQHIKHALDLYYATNEKYPESLDEFMNEIIKPNNIALPRLPYYQEYGYDSKEHKLVVLEYPDRKVQFQQQQDKKYGRD